MKELSIEEKAKAYDEAIAKAQKELQSCSSKDCDAARQIYRFFPELQESEDERIRKAIITFFESEDDNTTYALVPKKDILAWLEKQVEKKLANSENIGKNDTLLDLLQKMPSCITVDGIDYHFVLKKTSYYLAYYKGNKEEYSGNAIFVVTAFSPIDLLTEMLDKLKEKGLLG